MDDYSKNLKAALVESNQKIAAALEAKAQAIEGQVRAGEKSAALLKTASGYREDAVKIEKIAADFKAENVALKAEIVEVKAKFETLAKPVPTIQQPREAVPSLGPNARARLRAEQMAQEALKTAVEPPLSAQAPAAPPRPEKTPREAFLSVWAGIKMVTLNMIDGARLDAADGRLGLFSWLNRATGGRNQVLCEVPFNKVMPKIGEVFDSRAVPGKGKGGIGD